MKDIPNFHYFRSHNIFSGSDRNFRYRLEPGEELQAIAWFGCNCLEKTDPEKVQRQSFSMDDDGLAAALAWLDQQNNQ